MCAVVDGQQLYDALEPKFDQVIGDLKNSSLAVAVSGGSDSLALAILLSDWCAKRKLKLIALTVDHALRMQSDDEAKQVAAMMDNYNIEHHILYWEHDELTSNIQAQARKARYELLCDFCQQHYINVLCVAHTQDDQAETFLMRALRGSGVDGLAAIKHVSDMNDVRIIRPLLKVTKLELQEYLNSIGQQWCDDPSNYDAHYQRVNIRNWIDKFDDPALLKSRLADVCGHMARAQNYIESQVKHVAKSNLTYHPIGYIEFADNFCHQHHREIVLRVVKKVLQTIGGQDDLRFEKLANLVEDLTHNANFNGRTLAGCKVIHVKKNNVYRFVREVADMPQDEVYQQPCIWDKRFKIALNQRNNVQCYISRLKVEEYKELTKRYHVSHVDYTMIPLIIVIRDLEKLLYAPHIGYVAEGLSLEDVSCTFLPLLSVNKN